jgi:hypothetical protein
MRFVALLAFVALPGLIPAQHVGVINPSRGMQAPRGAYQYGNILFPGGIPSTPNNHAARLGGTIAGNPYPGIGPGGRPGGPGGRPRTVVVPYAYPVFVGGGGYYGYGYDQQPNNVTVVVPQQQTPQVIINNSYVPETAKPTLREYSAGELEESSSGIRVYEGAKPRPQQQASRSERSIMDEKPTIYLIALTDGTIRQAIGYWQTGDTFHYVTPESSINHLSTAMVDRERSIELNAERKLDFDLKITR